MMRILFIANHAGKSYKDIYPYNFLKIIETPI